MRICLCARGNTAEAKVPESVERERMKKRHLLLACAVAVPLLSAGPASAQQQRPVSGRVEMTVHTHSGGTLLFPVERLPFEFATGDTFSYSSRLCRASAPFNDIGLNFVPDYPGVDDDDGTARVRHGIQGTVTAVFGSRGIIQGKLTTVLCVPGPNGTFVESQHVIVSYFQAAYRLVSDVNLQIDGGFRFSPTESTGTFRDLQGGGRIQGRFTCLGQATCATLGQFTDFVGSTGDPNLPPGQLQPGLSGSYYDPTVGPVA